jgi:hypothetical protein
MSKLSPLHSDAIAARGATHVFEYTHEDLTEATANTAQTLDILTVGAGYLVECVSFALKTDFEDASDAAFNTTAITVGDSGDADRLLASTETNTNGTEIDAAAGTGTVFAPTSDTTIQVTVNAMADKSLEDIDAGKALIYLKVTDNR